MPHDPYDPTLDPAEVGLDALIASSNGHVPDELDRALTKRSTSGAAGESARTVDLSYADRIRARLVDTPALCRLPPPAPVVSRWLNLNTLAVIYGASGAGKSHVALDVAGHVTEHDHWNGYAITRGQVLYIVAEGAAGMARRAEAWSAHHDVEPRIVWHPAAINLTAPEWAYALAEVAGELRPALVIVDTFARSTPGMDENSARDVGLVVAHLDAIREASGSCVTLVHHTGKDTTKGARGSSALKAAVDTEIEVVGSEGRLSVRCTKQRDGAEPGPLNFRLIGAAESVVLERVDQSGGVHASPLIDEAARLAVEAAQADGGTLSMRRLVERIALKARRDTKIAGIEEAVARGDLRESSGPRGARLFEVQS